MNAHVKNLGGEVANAASTTIAFQQPYVVTMLLTGVADMLFHRWQCEAVAAKAAAKKGSASKKSDDWESYLYRTDNKTLGLPGEYVRQAVIHAAKFRQDPRSSRKSAMDLFKAGIVSLTQLADLGINEPDYLDQRRVVIQRAGITRTRPAVRAGWKATIEMQVLVPEYIDQALLRDVVDMAGRLVGLGDFRPTYGRFVVDRWEV